MVPATARWHPFRSETRIEGTAFVEQDDVQDAQLSWAGRAHPPSLEGLSARLRHHGQWDQIDTGPGWWPLLVRLDERLGQVAPDYEASSIRDVDGLLEFHASSTPDSVAFTDAVWEAMLEAARTCSVCGRPGVRRHDDRGRFATLCDDHPRPPGGRERALLAEPGASPATDRRGGILPPAETCAAVSTKFVEAVSRTHLAAADIARGLRASTDEVYRMYLAGELVGARGNDGQVVYPRWQVREDGKRIPGLAKVAGQILHTWHPVDVRDIMLRPNDDLHDVSPVEWLVTGFPASAITALLLSYKYEGLPVSIIPGEPPLTRSYAQQSHDDVGTTADEVQAERIWDEVRGRLHAVLGQRSELAAALGAYAVENQNQIRIDEVRVIREEYGTSRDPSAEELLPFLHSQRSGRDSPVA